MAFENWGDPTTSNSDLTGTVVLVTGATSSIDQASALWLSERSAHVLVDPVWVCSNPGTPAGAIRQGPSSLIGLTENERRYQ